MARFLTTKGSLFEIENVIQRARRRLTIITPFVQVSDDFARRLQDADQKDIEIRLVCRVGSLAEKQKAALAEYRNLVVYDDEKLHAKCFVNESGLVLTSLNFYEASEQNNEMGVYLDSETDRAAYEEAVREADSIVRAAGPPVDFGSSRSKPKRSGKKGAGNFITRGRKAKAAPTGGNCIRCGTGMDYDPKKPYCGRCFRQWLRFKNPTYADDRCHGCGAEDAKAFSLEKPECYACYKRNAKAAVA